jgi:hypothetical protein
MEAETMRLLKYLSPEETKSEPIEHALNVRKALAQGNYGRFFKLFRIAPNMGRHLMDIFLAKHRILCLTRLALAYIATNVEVNYLGHLLAFDSPKECEVFLNGLGCKIINGDDGKKKLLCKESLVALKKAPLKVKESAKTVALTRAAGGSGAATAIFTPISSAPGD